MALRRFPRRRGARTTISSNLLSAGFLSVPAGYSGKAPCFRRQAPGLSATRGTFATKKQKAFKIGGIFQAYSIKLQAAAYINIIKVMSKSFRHKSKKLRHRRFPLGAICGGRGRPPHNKLDKERGAQASSPIFLSRGTGVLACDNSRMCLRGEMEGWGASWEEIVAGEDARPTRCDMIWRQRSGQYLFRGAQASSPASARLGFPPLPYLASILVRQMFCPRAYNA